MLSRDLLIPRSPAFQSPRAALISCDKKITKKSKSASLSALVLNFQYIFRFERANRRISIQIIFFEFSTILLILSKVSVGGDRLVKLWDYDKGINTHVGHAHSGSILVRTFFYFER